MKHLDEPIRWREQAFHWPRIILSFVTIYGAIALGIYATYRAYRYVTAASVHSRHSFNSLGANALNAALPFDKTDLGRRLSREEFISRGRLS
jgi:hypothetical protein